MRIAVLGAGSVGGALGKRFAEHGHEVRFGVPRPEQHADKRSFAALVGTVAEAAADAEIILLAVPFDAVQDALRNCGNLDGKILIDATNPLRFADGQLSLTMGFETSGAEQIAKMAPGARLVKCFNQTGFGNMAQPQYASGKSVMFICGDDEQANETVRALAEEIGFDALAIGKLEVARLLEPLAMLWIHLAFNTELARDFAFAVLRKKHD